MATKPMPKTVPASVQHEPSALVLKGDGGTTLIQPQVVAKIAGLAIREVPGVHNLVPFGAGQTLTSFARTISGGDLRELGVQVEVGTKEAAVDCRIVTEFGKSIPDVSNQIRESVSKRIQFMTGLAVTEVNIEVVDLWFEDDESPPDEPESRRVQ